jgi:hypothetical protein
MPRWFAIAVGNGVRLIAIIRNVTGKAIPKLPPAIASGSGNAIRDGGSAFL